MSPSRHNKPLMLTQTHSKKNEIQRHKTKYKGFGTFTPLPARRLLIVIAACGL